MSSVFKLDLKRIGWILRNFLYFHSSTTITNLDGASFNALAKPISRSTATEMSVKTSKTRSDHLEWNPQDSTPNVHKVCISHLPFTCRRSWISLQIIQENIDCFHGSHVQALLNIPKDQISNLSNCLHLKAFKSCLTPNFSDSSNLGVVESPHHWGLLVLSRDLSISLRMVTDSLDLFSALSSANSPPLSL